MIITDDIGHKAFDRTEPHQRRPVEELPEEPTLGVVTCDRIASSTRGFLPHRGPDPPKDSIGVRAFSKLFPQNRIPEPESSDNVSG
eukprot:CAMPEP_0178708682 /NCGR_PEP_ID=MMETSP0699-20121125/16771_1 /TAXON_ID=265572 /ORGANISM="Extubocellulus spinifer, Strain CCMP396" /LENGTH=85 /DNA_ID=CAMNT_0020356967 /DNA_START=198 /DNA_END=455 /DNA_ORIENTATION=+